MGLGMGFSMMPTFSGAMQTLRRVAVARASTTLNIHPAGRRLDRHRDPLRDPRRAAVDRLGGGPAVGARLPPGELRATVAAAMAEAFGATFWWALALIVPAIACALLLPRKKPEPFEEEEGGGADEAAPVLMHV